MATQLLNLPPSSATSSEAGTAPYPDSRARRMPSWFREPLLHFLVAGGLLFAVDRVVTSRADDPHTIVIGAEQDREAIETFKASRGRDPTTEELEALRRVWLDNEVLYREGLALNVDKGDPAIRERVIFKALSIVDSNVKLPPADERILRAWYDSHRDKYDEPARFDFEEAALAGNNSEAAVRDFVAALNSGAPGDAKAGLRVFKGRPRANLVESYGADFARALESSPIDVWQAMKAKDAWRAVRLKAATPPRPAVFEVLRGLIQQDWADATASEQRTNAVRQLAKKYKVKHEPAAK